MDVYKVKWSWNRDTEGWLSHQKRGLTLNICCGKSQVGHIRADIDKVVKPDVVCDVHFPPFKEHSFDTVICDPPFSLYCRFKWIVGLANLTRGRLILSHGTNDIKLGRQWKKRMFATSENNLFLRFWSFWDKISLEKWF